MTGERVTHAGHVRSFLRSVEPLPNWSPLRMFARKFSNSDFFLEIVPLKDDELVTSET